MVQWAPITGLSDSCSPPLWLHLHWEHPATDGRPVEDIVNWHRVISTDSLQETMVHCTQFKDFTVYGRIWLYEGCILYLQLTILREKKGGNIRSQDIFFCLGLFLNLVCFDLRLYCFLSFRMLLPSNAEFRRTWSFRLSLMSIRLEEAKFGPSADSGDKSLDITFPRILIKKIPVLLC